MIETLKRHGTIFLLAGLIIAITATIIWIYVNKEVKQQDQFSGAKFVMEAHGNRLELIS